MKNIITILFAALLMFACSGGGSHSNGSSDGGATTIDYEDIEIYPINATGYFEGCSKYAYDGNEDTYSNVYHPVFKSHLKVEFPCDDYGTIKEQEFWALLHGNGHDVTVRESGTDGETLGTVNPPNKGWFKFISTDPDWCKGIWFCCDGGEQIMVFEVYKIVTYEEQP